MEPITCQCGENKFLLFVDRARCRMCLTEYQIVRNKSLIQMYYRIFSKEYKSYSDWVTYKMLDIDPPHDSFEILWEEEEDIPAPCRVVKKLPIPKNEFAERTFIQSS